MRPWLRAFTAEGLNIERLIRQAGERDIILTGLRRSGGRRVSGYAAEDDLAALAALAEAGGWRFEVGARRGAGRVLDAVRRRWPLAVGCLMVATGLFAASRLIWRVELVNAGVYGADLRGYLTELGVRPLTPKQSVDLAHLRDSLEWRYPEVAWIECGFRGMTLTVTVVDGVAPGDALTHLGSGDVVAARDGIVDSVITLVGTPLVQAGEIVRKGQTLIAGEERTSAGGTRPVSARGKVYARVWDGASVRVPLTETETTYTGRRQEVAVAACPWFDLGRAEDSGFDQQDVSVRVRPLGGLFLPFTVRLETRMEAVFSTRPRDPEQARAEAAEAALRRLREKAGPDNDFLTKWVDYSMMNDEELWAVAVGESIRDIALPARAP